MSADVITFQLVVTRVPTFQQRMSDSLVEAELKVTQLQLAEQKATQVLTSEQVLE